jgi:phosphate-selective porin OprO/OprP
MMLPTRSIVLALVVLLLPGPAPISAQEAPPKGEQKVGSVKEGDEGTEDAGDQEIDYLESEYSNRPSFFWDEGLHVLLPRARLHAQAGGWLQLDGMLIGDDAAVARVVGPLENGAEVRRARLNVEGDAIGLLEYRVRFEITGFGGTLRDFFVGVRGERFRLRAGHMREPIGMENNTNGLNTTFMERSLPTPRVSLFSTGVQVSNGSRSIFHLRGEVRRFTYAVGVFQNSNSQALVEGSSKAITGRVTALPLDGTGDRPLIHTGVSFSTRRYSEDDTVGLAQRPEANLAPDFVFTENLKWSRSHHLFLEGALIWNRVLLQAEYVRSWGSLRDESSTSFETGGFQLLGSYFLTDDMRVYRYNNGSFGPVYPKSTFPHGTGAIELTTRLSRVDMNDEPLVGGRLTDWTLGVNWYWTRHTRWSINYINAWLHDVGHVPIVQARFQIFI